MRLDVYLVEKGYFDSRTKAKQAIERGEVFLDGKVIYKSSLEIVGEPNSVDLIRETEFVSLGGYKLHKALIDFNLVVKDLVVADIGASTGGFTDCLLKNGAKTVFAVDLNDGLLHEKLQRDDRVISVIKNARELTKSDFSLKLDMLVADLSFISATYVLKTFSELLDQGKKVVLLIKPQFETGGKKRFKNGIIRDSKIHKSVCESIFNFAQTVDLYPFDFTLAPKKDGKNVEFLLLLVKGEPKNSLDISKIKYS